MKTLKLTLAFLLTVCCCCAQSSQSTSGKAQKVKEQVAVLRAKQKALQEKKEQARRDSLARAKALKDSLLKDSLLKDSLKKARVKPSDIKVDPTGKHFENSPLGQTDAGHALADLKNEKGGGAPLPPTRPQKPKAARPCPLCGEAMVRRVVVYSVKCEGCGGKGWIGFGKNKEEARKNRTLQDPCKFCQGKGTITLKGERWVCQRCRKTFK